VYPPIQQYVMKLVVTDRIFTVFAGEAIEPPRPK